MTSLPVFSQVVFVGVGATVVMDLWLLALKRAGVPTLDFALLGRWVGYLLRGRFRHDAIRRAPALAGEVAVGWLAHYAVGIALAGALVAIQGTGWLLWPAAGPALAWGLITTALPLFVMQPAMGAGFASSKTPTPLINCLRSTVNHAVFGIGLYLGAELLMRLTR